MGFMPTSLDDTPLEVIDELVVLFKKHKAHKTKGATRPKGKLVI